MDAATARIPTTLATVRPASAAVSAASGPPGRRCISSARAPSITEVGERLLCSGAGSPLTRSANRPVPRPAGRIAEWSATVDKSIAALGGEAETVIIDPPYIPHGGSSTDPEATPGGQPDPGGGGQSAHAPRDRLRNYSVVLITFIAALGAIITWRAEVAATAVAELTQRGVVTRINLAAEQTQDRAQAVGEETDVLRVQDLLDQRDLLHKELRLQGPADAQLQTEYDVTADVADWELRNDWAENYYLHSASTAPTYDLARRTSDLVAESRIPTDSAVFFARANREQDKRRNLLLLDIGLVIGLSCATVAQLARRHRLQAFCAAGGTIIFTLAIIAFAVIEV